MVGDEGAAILCRPGVIRFVLKGGVRMGGEHAGGMVKWFVFKRTAVSQHVLERILRRVLGG